MTAAAVPSFPGSRTVAGWWHQLAPYQPRALWVAHLLFHRVEALVGVARRRRADRFTQLVLQALALVSGERLDRLDDRLHLGRQLVGQVLAVLRAEGLAQVDADGRWSPTDVGLGALERGDYPQATYERRVFHFVDGERLGQPPHFVHLGEHAGVFWPAGADWRFHIGLLRACLAQSAGWKQQHGFAPEVLEVVGPEAEGGSQAPGNATGPTVDVASRRGAPEWQRVILDQPERLLAVLVRVPAEAGEERLLGFAAGQPGWALETAVPVLSLDSGWHEPFPELVEEPPLDVWRRAWRAWGQPRGLAVSETDACGLERHDYRLRVAAPHQVVDKLRLARSDALKGEAWLLAGEGRIRPAAVAEVVEYPPHRHGPVPGGQAPGHAGRYPTRREPPP